MLKLESNRNVLMHKTINLFLNLKEYRTETTNCNLTAFTKIYNNNVF